MEILENKENETLKLALKGRLDAINAPNLEEKIDNLAPDTKKLIIDFENLDYISSAGLRTLSKAIKKMNSTEGTLEILNVKPAVMSVFKMSGFDKILNIG